MMNSKAISALVIAISTTAPASAYGAQLEFDCDVPADHFSSVSQGIANGGSVSGTIRIGEMRKGNNLPVAGAGIFGPENKSAAGFQLIASGNHSRSLELMFNVANNGDVKKEKVGEVDASSSIEFSISLSVVGTAVLTINGRQFKADASAISAGRAMAFCSTAQFKFTNLTFSANSDRSGG
jgi:hypothetical protein